MARPGVCESLLPRAWRGYRALAQQQFYGVSFTEKKPSGAKFPAGTPSRGSIQPILSFRPYIYVHEHHSRVPGDSDVIAIGYELIAAGVRPAGINGLGTGLATHIASINRSLN